MGASSIIPDDQLIANSAIRGIPLPQDPAMPAIALPKSDSPFKEYGGGGGGIPLATSNNGIPVRPQTKSGAIPIDPVSGNPEPLNNKGIPIRAGVAGLWAKADNIHNPVLRVLGKIGAGAARAIDTAGEVLTPGLESKIPGSEGNERVQLARKNEQESIDAKQDLESAQTANLKSETDARDNPKDKVGNTPEEVTIHDLMTGENGQPRVNPDTGKPYSYLEAYGATKQAAADTKTPPADKPAHITYDSGIPVSVVDPKGKVYDVNDPKLPPELKPLVDAANRAHGQHVTEDANKQANAAKLNAPAKADARADKSYQFHSGQLDKLQTPVEAAVGRLGRLQDTLNQKTPQADALVAPELLTVMAGGAGSGLRMNEAEISRIVGGRSQWESLKAAVNKWSLDPKEARSITPEQQKEIHALTSLVQKKLQAKQQILDDGRQALINSEDPTEHRRILADTRKKLTAVDAGEAEAAKQWNAKTGRYE